MKLFWVFLVVVVIAIAVGLALAQPSQSIAIALDILVERYHSLDLWAVIVGVAAGAVGGVLAQGMQHRVGESGASYNSRVVWRGVWTSVIAAALAVVLTLALAAISPLEPLDVWATFLLIASSTLFAVALAIAFVCSMVAYAVVTRFTREWGGQYALIPHFG